MITLGYLNIDSNSEKLRLRILSGKQLGKLEPQAPHPPTETQAGIAMYLQKTSHGHSPECTQSQTRMETDPRSSRCTDTQTQRH